MRVAMSLGMNSLMATFAFSWVSRARYVMPKPPWPRTRPTIYRSFNTVPARRATGNFFSFSSRSNPQYGQAPPAPSRSWKQL